MHCEVCGKEIRTGYTDECGTMHVCDDCFADYMDENFGRGEWMALGNGEEDGYGGYYITTADVPGGYEGTGIFWTEFEE